MNTLSLAAPTLAAIQALLTEKIEKFLRPILAESQPGHCLQITTLPIVVAEQLGARLESLQPRVRVRLLRTSPQASWEATASQLIELRNQKDSALLVIVPPGEPVPDSLEINNFVEISLGNVTRELRLELEASIGEIYKTQIRPILNELAGQNFLLSDEALLRYYLTIRVNQSSYASVGGALFQLGLMPDFALLNSPEQIPLRLSRNLRSVQALASPKKTLLAEINALGLKDQTFRARLFQFLVSPERRAEQPQVWGQEIATAHDTTVRTLAFEFWEFEDQATPRPPIIYVQELKTSRRQDDNLAVFELKPSRTLPVRWEMDESPTAYPELHAFRIEIVSTEGATVHETDNIKVGTRAARSFTLKKLDEKNIPEDLYYLRVRAYDRQGNPINKEIERNDNDGISRKTNESENIWFYDDGNPPEVDPLRAIGVHSFLEAKLLAQFRALQNKQDPFAIKPPKLDWLDKPGARRAESNFRVQYDIQHEFTISISSILKRIEQATLQDAGNLGRWSLDLVQVRDPRLAMPQLRSELNAPDSFLQARQKVFENLHEIETVAHLTSTCDLLPLTALIQEYTESYREWLETIQNDLKSSGGSKFGQALRQAAACLDIDTVQIQIPFGAGQQVRALLIAPTHPLRLFWHLQWAQMSRAWIQRALEHSQPERMLSNDLRLFLRNGLSADSLPLTVWSENHAFMDAGALTPFWHLYLPPSVRDSRSVRSKVERLLAIQPSRGMFSRVRATDVTQKLEQYIIQHPYVTTLKLNVINPGDASILRDAIEELNEGYPNLHFQVHLFADQARMEDIGSALEELTNPERQVGPSLDPFSTPSSNPLFPKLKYARGRLADFLKRPTDFEAHISLLFESFGVTIENVPLANQGRSSYLYGLVQEPLTRFQGGEGVYVWQRSLAPTRTSELQTAPNSSAVIAHILRNMDVIHSSIAALSFAPGAAPAIQLDLKPADKELLYQIHAASDWALIIDHNLGLEYFDSPSTSERPVYLIDFSPQFGSSYGERLLLTTRSTQEVVQLIRPALVALGLENLENAAELILESLRSLSGRLALKLLAAPNQVDEVIGLALARLLLEQYELVSDRVLIPLDAHTGIFRAPSGMTMPVEEYVRYQRGDLLIVGFQPDTRTLEFNVVEVKTRQDVGTIGNYLALKETMREQLDATENALHRHFDPGYTIPDRVDRELETQQLAELLGFYLDRAQRYGLVSPQVGSQIRQFIDSLDEVYTIEFLKTGLVFDFGTVGISTDEDALNLVYHRVGVDYARRMLENTLAARKTARVVDLTSDQALQGPPTLMHDPTFERVRNTFSRRTRVSYEAAHNEKRGQVREGKDVLSERGLQDSSEQAETNIPLEYQVPPSYEVLVADNQPSPQYGLLGQVGDHKVALDLNGCNTISLFGVQGGGKSYTIGTIVEMATQPIPHINALPKPLASVIFHFHESQAYPPEFASMNQPNDNASEIERLGSVYGATPQGLRDVIILTSSDKLADRRREFPSLRVEPIAFNPTELGIKDWLFLMGAIGNPSMYVQQINVIMRRLRNRLTLEGLYSEIANSSLDTRAKELARNRLAFAEEFLRHDQSLREFLLPGRLLIVDLRDELISKEQALGLFVVMLNIFSGAGMDNPFNKLIVFDEAHKYITHSDLLGHVVETIREMRHKGVNIVLASQDPPSLPTAVIELSSVVLLHKFNSPKWLSHIQKSLAVLGELSPDKLNTLKPGEAYLWANKATDAVFTTRAVKILMRPRVTLHGGTTRRAVS